MTPLEPPPSARRMDKSEFPSTSPAPTQAAEYAEDGADRVVVCEAFDLSTVFFSITSSTAAFSNWAKLCFRVCRVASKMTELSTWYFYGVEKGTSDAESQTSLGTGGSDRHTQQKDKETGTHTQTARYTCITHTTDRHTTDRHTDRLTDGYTQTQT